MRGRAVHVVGTRAGIGGARSGGEHKAAHEVAVRRRRRGRGGARGHAALRVLQAQTRDAFTAKTREALAAPEAAVATARGAAARDRRRSKQQAAEGGARHLIWLCIGASCIDIHSSQATHKIRVSNLIGSCERLVRDSVMRC